MNWYIYPVAFFIAGLFYFFFESFVNWIMYRKHWAKKLGKGEWSGFSTSSIWMFPVAGILGISTTVIHQIVYIRDYVPMLGLMFIGCVVITLIEFCSGMILNKALKLDIWDYTKFKLPLKKQIINFFIKIRNFFCRKNKKDLVVEDKKIPINVKGQICLWHSLGWLALSPFMFWLENIIRHFTSYGASGDLVNPLTYYIRIISDFFTMWR